MAKIQKETFQIPWETTGFLTEMVASIRVNSGIRVTKSEIIARLLDLLNAAKINTKDVQSAEDIIDQLKEHIGKSK
jgi:DNA repair photolyase